MQGKLAEVQNHVSERKLYIKPFYFSKKKLNCLNSPDTHVVQTSEYCIFHQAK